jgi:hypothetical protein
MKTLLLTILLAFYLNSGAQVLVYKNRVTATVTRENLTTRTTIGGYTVIDGNSGGSYLISAYSKTKHFYVFQIGWNVTVVTGSSGKRYTTYCTASSSVDDAGYLFFDSIFMKGLNVPHTDIGDPNYLWQIPRSMPYTARSIYPSYAGYDLVQEESGTLALDLKTTQAYNGASYSLTNAVDALRANLTALGYVEQ